MKITSWNVNSVTARILNIKDYIKLSNPDILMIQEIKTEDKSFPYADFERLGYNSFDRVHNSCNQGHQSQ